MRIRLLFPLFLLIIVSSIVINPFKVDEQEQAPLADRSTSVVDSFLIDSFLHDFISIADNQIQDSERIADFFQKLKLLDNNQLKQIRIAHIGDSHIQADFFPGQLRYMLQKRFGSAGRGLVFPYQQAGTHSPIDAKSKSNIKWENRRSVFKHHDLPIGLSGMSIRTNNPNFVIEHYLKERYGLLEPFDQVTIFHPDDRALFDFRVISENKKMNTVTLGQYHTQFYLSEAGSTIKLGAQKNNINQKYSIIHGVLLEDTQQTGILYNTIGVNGTTYYHYNRCHYFLPQLSSLKPDLIIVSLGTNEALTSNFTAQSLEQQMEKFLSQLRTQMPNVAILLTTLPDSFKQKKYANPNGPVAQRVIKQYANMYNCATWDLFQVMGGKGSMEAWVEEQLGYIDYIHFTRKGYELQAMLLYDAIQKHFQ